MANNSRYTIICPCCEATLTIDAQTGAMLSHEEKAKPVASFDEMVKGLDAHVPETFSNHTDSITQNHHVLLD